MSLAKWIITGLAVATSFATAAEPSKKQADLEPGLWQFHIQYDVMGMPQTFEPYTTTRCISHDDPLPQVRRSGQECLQAQKPSVGNTIRWELDCSTDAELVHGQGRIRYVRNRGNGEVYVQTLGVSSPPYTMAFHIQGERIGTCH